MNKQRLVLLLALIILVLSLVYSYVRMPRQQTAAKLTYTQGMKAPASSARPSYPSPKQAPPVQPGENQIMLSLLEQPADGFKGVKRNIFKPIFHEEAKIVPLPPPPPAPPKSILPSKPATAAPPVLPPQAPVSPVDTARQEMGRLRFLGFLKKDTRKTIFLAEGAEIFLVRKGDKIAGRYEVTNLTDDAITISVLADKSDLVFPLVENRTLTAATRR